VHEWDDIDLRDGVLNAVCADCGASADIALSDLNPAQANRMVTLWLEAVVAVEDRGPAEDGALIKFLSMIDTVLTPLDGPSLLDQIDWGSVVDDDQWTVEEGDSDDWESPEHSC
jgi:hypothetical protein